nr:alpha/beta fold hydrolase [Leifsonia aquatica]
MYFRNSADMSSGVRRRRALTTGERFAGFSCAVSSLEALADHRELNDDGVRRASKINRQDPGKTVIGRAIFRALDRKWALVALHSSRVLAGTLLTVSPTPKSRAAHIIRGIAGAQLAVSEGLLAFYNRYGSDGADQATTQILAPAAIARLSTNPRVQDAALWYTALQGTLSYAVAGVAKLFGKEWREGTAITGVLRTQGYGHERLWKFFDRHPKLAKSATWGTVAWEVSYPLALLPAPAITRLYSASAIAFHLVNGYAMGLGRFAWAFAGVHPAINYVAHPGLQVHRPAGDVPRAAVATSAVAIGGLAVANVARSLSLRELPLGWEQITASSGNTLAYQGRSGVGDTLVVFEGGLAASIEMYQWYADSLTQKTDFSVVAYERAGYGASTLSPQREAEWTLDAAVDDLKSLIDHLRLPDQRLVIAAHSMGGEIARLLVNRYPGFVDALVFIDSTNINQFTDGSLSMKEQRKLLDAFATQRRITSFGIGPLNPGTPPTRYLPAHSRKRAVAQERNHRMWRAAQREYAALLRSLPDQPIPLFTTPIPCLVVASKATVELDDQRKHQEELVEATRDPSHADLDLVVVDGKHDSMIAMPHLAADLANITIDFLKGRPVHGAA